MENIIEYNNVGYYFRNKIELNNLHSSMIGVTEIISLI